MSDEDEETLNTLPGEVRAAIERMMRQVWHDAVEDYKAHDPKDGEYECDDAFDYAYKY